MADTSDNKFGKNYKLCSEKTIEQVFDSGETVKEYPLLAKYIEHTNPAVSTFQIAISAPKRNFKLAVSRNRIKRILREVIRLNKEPLESYCTNNEKQLAIFLIFTSKEELDYHVLEKKVIKLFNKLIKQLDDKK